MVRYTPPKSQWFENHQGNLALKENKHDPRIHHPGRASRIADELYDLTPRLSPDALYQLPRVVRAASLPAAVNAISGH